MCTQNVEYIYYKPLKSITEWVGIIVVVEDDIAGLFIAIYVIILINGNDDGGVIIITNIRIDHRKL